VERHVWELWVGSGGEEGRWESGGGEERRSEEAVVGAGEGESREEEWRKRERFVMSLPQMMALVTLRFTEKFLPRGKSLI